MGTDGLTILDPKKYIEGRNSKMQNAVFTAERAMKRSSNSSLNRRLRRSSRGAKYDNIMPNDSPRNSKKFLLAHSLFSY
jgi:hypothetical protein